MIWWSSCGDWSSSEDDDPMSMMMLDLFDDGAHALDDGLGAIMEMIS